MEILKISNLNKSFGELQVLKGVSLSMQKGEVVAIIGASGGGKTTLLRCITFLEKADSGTITVDGDEIVTESFDVKSAEKAVKDEKTAILKAKKAATLAAKALANAEDSDKAKLKAEKAVANAKRAEEKADEMSAKAIKANKVLEIVKNSENNADEILQRNELTDDFFKSVYPKDEELRQRALKVGLVFQDYNLFPHKTVLQNCMLAPGCVLKEEKEITQEKAIKILNQVGLEDKIDSYPYQLSGGQKQRVAIARALCMNPSLLCFDEPTSALDPELTAEVLKVIRQLKDDGVTMLIVTHEINFAREVADTVIFLDNGDILEQGNAKELIDNPKNARTKEFLKRISE